MGLYGNKKVEPKERVKRSNAPLPKGLITIISQGTSIEGIIRVGNDVRIDGSVLGDVYSEKKVVLGEKGSVVGNVYCDVLELNGAVEGDIFSKTATKMNATASLKGNLNSPKFSIEMGAKFIGVSNGTSNMDAKKITEPVTKTSDSTK